MKNPDLPTSPVTLGKNSFISRLVQTRKTFSRLKHSKNYHQSVAHDANTDVPVLSVMLITYNHEKYIADSLDSILMQEGGFQIEINVIDDASTDNTQAIVLEYESRYPEIINCYFNEKNIGNKVTQLNTYRGFQTLRGEYFALLEGDDYWTDPEKLVRQIGFLKENPDYVACAHYTMKVFDDESSPPEHFLPFKAFNSVTATMYDLVAMNGVYHLSSIIYRNVFGQTPPQCLADPYSCEVTINMVYGQYGNFYCIDEYMSAYRVHGKGEFSTRSQEDIWRFHLHGFRHFFFYLGPVYYSIFSPVVLKYSRYVLRAPRAGFVKSLKLSTRILFAVHIVFFAPFLVLNLVNKRALGKVYLFLITHLPLPIKKGLRYIVNRSPRLYKLKLTLFDHFVGDDKRGPEED